MTSTIRYIAIAWKALALLAVSFCIVPAQAECGVKELIESGNKHFESRRYDDAISTYNRALVRLKLEDIFFSIEEKNLTSLYFNRGLAYFEKGFYKKAAEDFGTVMARQHNDATAAYYRGRAYELAGRRKEALLDYTKAITIDGSNGEYFFSRGVLLQKHRDSLNKAIEDLKRAVKIAPKNPSYQRMLAVSYFKKGRINAALWHFTRAIVLKKDFPEAYTGRGQCFIKKGEVFKAQQDFKKACSLGDKGGCIMTQFLVDYLEGGIEQGGDY